MSTSFSSRSLGGVLGRTVAIVFSLLVIGSAFATYLTMTRSDLPFGANASDISDWIVVNVILLGIMCGLVFQRVARMTRSGRHGAAGSRLQRRLVRVFSLLAVLPSICVSIFAGYLFHYGTSAWFNTKIRTALDESVAVAEAYLDEHKRVIKADILAMANDLNRQASTLSRDPALFSRIVKAQATVRSLTEAVVFQPDRILARSTLAFAFAFERIPNHVLIQASDGEVIFLKTQEDDRVRAIVKLEAFPNTYLLVGRFVDARVISHMERAKGASSEYQEMRDGLDDIQWQFLSVFLLITLLLLLLSLWVGMLFAGDLVGPIMKLYQATGRVRAGDYTARVELGQHKDEITALGRAFNRMTEQLDAQREELMEANRKIDSRRRFSETVLAGVSAGVVALDERQRINLVNRSACALLGWKPDQVQNAYLGDILPELDGLLLSARDSNELKVESDCLITQDNQTLTLHVRITAERDEEELEGYIVTFDDISSLVSAQRRAAWADVARRIAHEIKNPLTPIQLSAERLRKKITQWVDDKEQQELVEKYCRTINRHVGDIGQMVEEFSSFARMPAPVMAQCDLREVVEEAVFSEKQRWPKIRFQLILPKKPIMLMGDATQLGRAVGNVLKNAAEAMEAKGIGAGCDEIKIELRSEENQSVLAITDQGGGLPEHMAHQLTEPYVTTKEKGTGLGLAIVQKILQDHGAIFQLENSQRGGVVAFMSFPIA